MNREDIIKIIEAHTKGNYLMGSMSKQKIADEILNASQQSTISDEEIENWVCEQFNITGLDYDENVKTQYGYLPEHFKDFARWMRDKLQPIEPINKGLNKDIEKPKRCNKSIGVCLCEPYGSKKNKCQYYW